MWHTGFDRDTARVRPATLTDATFSSFIARTDLLVLVKFLAQWRGSPGPQGDSFRAAAEQLHEVQFASVDVDANPQATRANAIRSVPTVVLYRSGKELARYPGSMDLRTLSYWIRAHTRS